MPALQLRNPLAAWSFAIALAVGTTLLNFEIQALVGARAPFLPFFPAVAAVAYFAGVVPAALFIVSAALAVNYFWMAPSGVLDVSATSDVVALALFILASAVIVKLAEAHRSLSSRNAAVQARLDEAQVANGIVEWQWDPRSGGVQLSHSAAQVFGMTYDHIDASWTLAHPDDAERVKAAVERGLGERGYSFTSRMVRPDTGAVRWIETRAVVHGDAGSTAQLVTGVTIDVTDKHEAFEAAAAARREAQWRAAELETLLDSVPGIIWIARDPQCRRVTGSAAAYDALRIPRGGNLSKTAPETEVPRHFRVLDENGDELAAEALPLQRAAATGVPQLNRRIDIEFDDGTRRILYGNTHPLRDAAGAVAGAVAGFADVTALMETQAALRRAADEFERIVNLAPIGIVVARDPACELIASNPYVERLLGAAPAAAMPAHGAEDGRLDHALRRDGAPVAAHDTPLRKAAAAGAITRSEVFELVRRDGGVAEVMVSAVPLFDEHGNPRGAIGTVQDVTEHNAMLRRLHDSEERLRLAVDGADLGLWDTDLATGVTENSARSLELLGLPRDTGPLQPSVRETLIHPEDRPRVVDAWQRPDARGQSHVLEYRIVRPDGAVRWMESRARIRSDPAGVPRRILGITMDVTERKEAEQALREANLRKDEFLATLAHELRNPLAPIRYASRLFRADTPPEMIEDAGRMVERQLSHMARLLDDLLDVSRVTRGVLDVHFQQVDLRTAVNAALEAARPLAEKADHRLEVKLPAMPLPVSGDLARLTQIVGNLLNNATKYTDPGGRIVVEVAAVDHQAVVEVLDNGIGIAPQLLPRVFDMFTQGERGARSTSGLGIGLALAQRLVNLHGGTLEAFSAGPGRGSRFVMRLPRVEEAKAVSEPLPGADKVRVLGATGTRILIVDDNVDAAESLAHVLRLAGYTTKTAYDGATALDVAEVLRPAVVLLDLGLPGLSGYDVARRIRAGVLGEGVRLIAITGWGQEDDRRRTREAGFDEHLTKPVDPEALLSLIASAGRAAA